MKSEQDYEKALNIKTSGDQKIFNDSLHYHRYEPTSYSALEELFSEYKLLPDDNLIDFGCGKGRLNFFIHHKFDSYVTGIEMNSYFYDICLHNKSTYLKSRKKTANKINFINCFAEKYVIKECDNKFYFFNPFSLQIFIKVVENILDSVDEFQRVVDIILYYPSEDYVYYLENNTCFNLIQEVRLFPKYDKDERQKFCIYRLDLYFS